MSPGVALAVGGLVLTSFGLYQIGYALTAASTPYGFGLVIAALCLLIGGGLLLAAGLERHRFRGRVTPLAWVLGLTVSLGALMLGLLQPPPNDPGEGLRCRAQNGNVYDCEDPRIDEPEEKVAVLPGSRR